MEVESILRTCRRWEVARHGLNKHALSVLNGLSSSSCTAFCLLQLAPITERDLRHV